MLKGALSAEPLLVMIYTALELGLHAHINLIKIIGGLWKKNLDYQTQNMN